MHKIATTMAQIPLAHSAPKSHSTRLPTPSNHSSTTNSSWISRSIQLKSSTMPQFSKIDRHAKTGRWLRCMPCPFCVSFAAIKWVTFGNYFNNSWHYLAPLATNSAASYQEISGFELAHLRNYRIWHGVVIKYSVDYWCKWIGVVIKYPVELFN